MKPTSALARYDHATTARIDGAGDDDRRDRGVGGPGSSGPDVHTPTATVAIVDVAGPPQAGAAELHRPRRVVTDRQQVRRAATSHPPADGIEVQRRQQPDPDHPDHDAPGPRAALGPGRQPARRVPEHHPRDQRRAQPGDHQTDREQQRRADRRGVPLAGEPRQPGRRPAPARGRHGSGARDMSAAAAMSAQPAPTRATTPTHERPANEYAGLSMAIDHAAETDDEPDHAEHQPARHRPIVAHHAAESMGADPCRPGDCPHSGKRDEGDHPAGPRQLGRSAPMCAEPGDVHDRRIDSQEVLTMVFKMSRLAGGFAGVAALTVACGGVNSDRAGGAANVDPVVLTMAQNSDVPPSGCRTWADDVAARIRRQPADRVRQRAGDTVSPSSRRARSTTCRPARSIWRVSERERSTGLASPASSRSLAPLLIDSHDLQTAVFEAGIPDEMLAGLDDDRPRRHRDPARSDAQDARRVTPVRRAGRLRRAARRDPGLGDSPSRRCSRSARTTQNMPTGGGHQPRLDAYEQQLDVDRRQRLSGVTPSTSPPTSTCGHGRRCCS